MRELKVMAEYCIGIDLNDHQLPLWTDGLLADVIDLDIEISPELRRDLIEWNDIYEKKDINANVTSEFVSIGRVLAERIKVVAQGKFSVTYYNDLLNEFEEI